MSDTTGSIRRWPAEKIGSPLASRLPLPALDLLIVLESTVTIAFVSLWIEDLFPVPPEPGPSHWDLSWTTNWWRLIGLGIGLFLLWGTVQIRRIRTDNVGTLNYLYLQPENFPDYHEAVVHEAETRALDFREATAVFDPGDGIIDIRRHVASVAAELQRSENDDRHDTGSVIAPNLTFPAALAIGYDWFPLTKDKIQEFNGREERAEYTFELSAAPFMQPLLQSADIARDHDLTEEEVRSVWLSLRVTDRDEPEIVSVDNTKPLRNLADIVRVVGVFDSAGAHLRNVAIRKDGVAEIDGTAYSADRISRDISYWIRDTLTAYSNATVFVSARVPKAVALASGHYLRRILSTDATAEAAQHPWRRIVPITYLLNDDREDRPTLVREQQIDPAELLLESGIVWPENNG